MAELSEDDVVVVAVVGHLHLIQNASAVLVVVRVAVAENGSNFM